MGWEGYLSVDNREVINVARVEAYADNLGVSWIRRLYSSSTSALRQLLDHDPYTDPATDEAPWYEARVPHSAEFLGVYPLDLSGLDDTTFATQVVEGLGAGGSLTPGRSSTKAIPVSVVLFASTDRGMEHGWRWLCSTLKGLPDCEGYELAYMGSEPHLGGPESVTPCFGPVTEWFLDPTDALTNLARQRRHVGLATSPVVTAKRTTRDGGRVWSATFTLVAVNPFEFTPEAPLLTGWLDPATTNPWPGSVTPAGASISAVSTYTEVPCDPPVYSPVFDPLNPGISEPPSAPGIVWSNVDIPATWHRRIVTLPPTFITGWTTTLPVIRVTTTDTEIRNVRIRFYADPLQLGYDDDLACTFVSDMLITYIPTASVMVIDPADQLIYLVDDAGNKRRADSLVFDTAGKAITWPELVSGQQYLMVLDLEDDTVRPSIDVSLVERAG